MSRTTTALVALLLAHAFVAAQTGNRTSELEQAAALVAGGRLAEAEASLNRIIKSAPEEAGALNLLGTVRAKQGRLDEAEALFARAVRSDARLTGARMNLAHVYLLRGEVERSASELREVLRAEPSNAEAGHRLAWLLFTRGLYDECVAHVENLKRTQKLSPAVLAILGDAHSKKGEADKAERAYLAALESEPANADALLGMAQVWQTRGDTTQTDGYLARAKDATAQSPNMLSKFAAVALGAGRRDEAVAALKRAVALLPAEPSYHFALGAAWLRHPADLQGAEQSFAQYLTLKPGDARAQLLLGYILLKQKKHAEARAWLERSVERGAGTPEAFYYLGLIAQGQNEDARAVELFEKSVRLAPTFAHAHVALGATYLKLKDYERARQSLEAGAKLSPEDTKAHYNLALLYARLKDNERAREEMRIVEKLRGEGASTATDDGDDVAPPPPPL